VEGRRWKGGDQRGVGVLVCLFRCRWAPGYTPLPIRENYDVSQSNHGQMWVEGDHREQQNLGIPWLLLGPTQVTPNYGNLNLVLFHQSMYD
jgi:hypothetical protein